MTIRVQQPATAPDSSEIDPIVDHQVISPRQLAHAPLDD